MFSIRQELSLYSTLLIQILFQRAMQWRHLLIVGLPSRRSLLDPRSAHVGFATDEVVLGQVFLPVLRFSPVNTVPSPFHTHINLRVSFTIRTKERSAWKPSKKQCSVGSRAALDTKAFSLFYIVKGC